MEKSENRTVKFRKKEVPNHKKKCLYCGVEYLSLRSTSKFCSDNHRKRYSETKINALKKAKKRFVKMEIIKELRLRNGKHE